MIRAFIRFHLTLVFFTFLPSWYQPAFLDEEHAKKHAHFRRATRAYRKKRRLVRNLWTGTGVFMIVFPTPPLLIGAMLFSTCLSFAILDESDNK